MKKLTAKAKRRGLKRARAGYGKVIVGTKGRKRRRRTK